MTSKKVAILNWLCAIFVVFLPGSLRAEQTVVIDRPQFEYTITIQAENMFARLYVNGAPLINHLRTDKLLFTYPITQYLRAGKNRIEVDYEPFNRSEQTYASHEGLALQIELRQLSGGARLAEVDLLSARYDPKIGELTPRARRVFGDTPVTKRGGNIDGSKRFKVNPIDMNYGTNQSGTDARRVSIDFQIDDETQKALPWDAAPVLEDTPAMRQALWAGYKNLYDASLQKNAAAYLAIKDPVLRRIAYTLGYKNTYGLVKNIWKLSPLGGPDGGITAPLPSQEAFRTIHLRWSADRRMVRAQQDPVAFLDGSGNKIGAYRVMFCQQPDGMMKVCHQMDIPY